MKFIKGINFATFARRGVLGSQEARESLIKMLDDLAADFVILTPAGVQEHAQSLHIDYTGIHTSSDEELVIPSVFCTNAAFAWRSSPLLIA